MQSDSGAGSSGQSGGAAGAALDGLRMAAGTLTAVPVRAERVDREVAGWAMRWAPLIGAGLGAAGGLLVLVTLFVGVAPPLAAALAVGLIAVLTRGLHLDGLADLADGLGSGKPADAALQIMKRSDIGPFGVITLVLVLLIQVTALAQVSAAGLFAGAAALVAAAAAGRLAITLACTPTVPSARPDGLGAHVAGTVPHAAAAASAVGTLLLASLFGAVHSLGAALALPFAAALGAAASLPLLLHARRRLGGITGDVLGALCETSATVALVAAAIAL
ncbi:adenosylcobinamide-GDP ribazoletransferase [Nocardiopsis baichengensis]|uniref:adenosylcobinamide-GDP ribazoletransferase n=1 Tax=Nocardiopsis baichengensis TaxID=280240 RepID=UPI00034A04DC|nr:adenosylcobinamide-GDP ribazoletransferase [Nocardiopsis baichengensis]